jgi:hypothetical protein
MKERIATAVRRQARQRAHCRCDEAFFGYRIIQKLSRYKGMKNGLFSVSGILFSTLKQPG